MPTTTSGREERRAAIRELLSTGPLATQRALVAELTRRGLTVTQSSVSRDLRDLGAIKSGKGYALPDTDQDGAAEVTSVAGLLRSATPAGAHLLIVKTATGAAQRVALALDRSGWPEIVGNIGGDDTVFVATATSGGQRRVMNRLERALRKQG